MSERPRALITGASSGIGAAFAHRLAERGHDLTLVARRRDRLEAVAAAVRERHGVAAHVLVADLATNDLDAVEAHLRDHPVDLLINNAGFGTPRHFADADLETLLAMITVHVTASVRLTHTALPSMIERRRGNIIQVSSIAAFLTVAGGATYAATKGYLNQFTRALDRELRGSGVRVQALCPGFTRTEFHDRKDYESFDRTRIPSFLWMTAEDVVDASLRALEQNKVVFVPGIWNRLLIPLARTRAAAWMGDQLRRRAQR